MAMKDDSSFVVLCVILVGVILVMVLVLAGFPGFARQHEESHEEIIEALWEAHHCEGCEHHASHEWSPCHHD